MLGRITVGALFVLLVWGNMVAGLKAGLACPDWPLCHGRVVPPFRLDIYMEFGHRVIAAVVGVLLVALSVSRFRSYTGAARAVPVAALVLLAAEVLMGGLVVLLGIPVRLTTIHFMTALAVFVLAFYMMRFDGKAARPRFSVSGSGGLFAGFMVVVFVQAALGAFVRHSEAGLACPDWPTCLGGFIPPVMDGRVMAHFSHRVVAYLILLTTVALYAATRLDARLMRSRPGAAALLVLACAQAAAGVGVVLSGLYFAATALHMAIALTMLYVASAMWAGEAAAIKKGAQP